MAEQKACNLSTVSTIASDDYLMAITDVVPENNVVEKISKADFITGIISTDSGNFIEVGTDDKLVLTTSNGASELVQLTASGKYPALDGSLITGVSALIDKSVIQLGTCTTASATAEKAVTLGITSLTSGLIFLVDFDNANTSATITLNVDTLGAKNIYDKRGTQITGALFNNRSNERCMFRYDSTLDGYELLLADFWSARMGMPSSSYADLTLGASSSTYTAPADGYITLNKSSTASGQVIRLYHGTLNMGFTIYSSANNQAIEVNLPVKKSDVVACIYNAAGATNAFRFVYAEGSKP